MCSLRSFPAAVLLNMAYGYNINPDGADYLVGLADEVNSIFSEASQPGRWLVDSFPVCASPLSFDGIALMQILLSEIRA